MPSVQRFLLDESSDYRIAPYLRRLGHDVTAIGQNYPASLRDTEVLAIAVHEVRIVITSDRDFGELVVRERLPHTGILLFRLGMVTIEDFISRMDVVLTEYAHLLGQFIIVTRRRIRVRPAALPK